MDLKAGLFRLRWIEIDPRIRVSPEKQKKQGTGGP
jgi:hypothetical protein